MSTRVKNLCLLGAGRMGQMHARSFVGHAGARLAAVADVVGDAARALADRVGAQAFDDPAAAVRADGIDGVIIATSTDTHLAMIRACLAAGKPVFCEKPIDLNLAEVDRCLAEIAEARLPLQIGFNRRFDPSFAALHDRLRGGAVGKLELVKITSRDPAPPPMAYVKVSGGLFRDMMIHDFDTARWLLGEDPVELHATASCLVDPAIGEAGDVDTAVVTMRTASGVLCSIENSRRAVYGYDQRIEVLGGGGMLQAQNPAATTVSHWGSEAIRRDKLLHFAAERYPDAFRAELDAFLKVLDGAAPAPDAGDGRAALALAEAALESLRTGATVRLGPLTRP